MHACMYVCSKWLYVVYVVRRHLTTSPSISSSQEDIAYEREMKRMAAERREFQDVLRQMKGLNSSTRTGNSELGEFPGQSIASEEQGDVHHFKSIQNLQKAMVDLQQMDADPELYKLQVVHLKEMSKVQFELDLLEQKKRLTEKKMFLELGVYMYVRNYVYQEYHSHSWP